MRRINASVCALSATIIECQQSAMSRYAIVRPCYQGPRIVDRSIPRGRNVM